ncbi:phosphatase PAP2 family protein [Clostridiales bacterium COT073_COT-073]|nr:phosphatase PAP2 family protein [Clostridiales bacterium COT073_COT-073]
MLYQAMTIADWDGEILLWIQENLRNDIFSDFLTFFTRLGNHGELWIGILLLLLIFRLYRRTALTAVISLVLTFLTVDFMIKPWVARIRPYLAIEGLERLVAAERSFSFPSGHASTAFAAAYVLFRELPLKYGLPVLILAIIMAFSRLYVAVHYPSDVVTGAVIGILIGEIVIQIRNLILKNKCLKDDK